MTKKIRRKAKKQTLIPEPDQANISDEFEWLQETHGDLLDYNTSVLDENSALHETVTSLRAQIEKLSEENQKLRAEIAQFKQPSSTVVSKSQSIVSSVFMPPKTTPVPFVAKASSNEAAFFRSLFRGREDVFAVRWEKKDGISGYSPECANIWKTGLCAKPKAKCFECKNQRYRPYTDDEVGRHLAGTKTIGIYPLLPDDTCWFLAVDFDEKNWMDDAKAFLHACHELKVPCALERSRSGNGGHIWIFFENQILASVARKLGAALLTHGANHRHQIKLSSYDRFFPNQDTMPRGGFGNLITLPLQAKPLTSGNSAFVDDNFAPYANQWEFLRSMTRISTGDVEHLVCNAERDGAVIGVRLPVDDEDSDDPWTLPPSKRKKSKPQPIQGPFPASVQITLANQVFIEKEGLSSPLINHLFRIAAFQNPEFYRKQAMRLPVFKTPRVVGCGEELPRHIALPRGCLEEAIATLKDLGIKIRITDKRFDGHTLPVEFIGQLRPDQTEAARETLRHDIGIVAAGTAFGKTVLAASVIAARKRNTLILVHREPLMTQWREQLAMFFGIPISKVGHIGGGKVKANGMLDVAMIQSLRSKGAVKDLVAEYGHIIIDECHHVSAFSFEQVIKESKARYVLGLTATPTRKDGHHPIIIMQCGPIRYRTNLRQQAKERPFEHLVIPRFTRFTMTIEDGKVDMPSIYAALAIDAPRNEMIIADILTALNAGRFPLVLTERTNHLDILAERLRLLTENVFVLKGGMSKKVSSEVYAKLQSLPEKIGRVILATGKYVGEGFDDPKLDTLFLALPISWKGTLQQYAGRLHRLCEGKQKVVIYDYVDRDVAVLERMYGKRLKGYTSLGYQMIADRAPPGSLFDKME